MDRNALVVFKSITCYSEVGSEPFSDETRNRNISCVTYRYRLQLNLRYDVVVDKGKNCVSILKTRPKYKLY